MTQIIAAALTDAGAITPAGGFQMRMWVGAALAGAMVVSAPAPVQAAALIWTISGGTFDDGGTFSGAFTYDADTNSYTDVNITTTLGSALGGADFNTVANGTASTLDLNYINFPNVGTLSFGYSDLTNAGGTRSLMASEVGVNLLSGSGAERSATAGTISAIAAAPEPASWAMMIAGFGIAGGALRRSRKLRAATIRASIA